MNRVEFDNEFLNRMAGSFERVKMFLDKSAGTPDELQRVAGIWFYILKDYSLRDAFEACDEVTKRERQPRFLEDIPRAIGQVCAENLRKRSKRHFTGGVQTFSCSRCLDRGVLIVFDPRPDLPAGSTCAVSCDICGKGPKGDITQPFRQDRMEPWSLEEELLRQGRDPKAGLAKGREMMGSKGLAGTVVDVAAIEPAVVPGEGA